MTFTDRAAAGRLLAERLRRWQGGRPVVLGVPRGGLPVAASVAAALDAELDVIVARKITVPTEPGLVLGAVSEDNVVVVNDAAIQACHLTRHEVAAAGRAAAADVLRRARLYRCDRHRRHLDGRIAIVVDDGMLTGTTARVACRSVWRHWPRLVVLAAPVMARDVARRLRDEASLVVSLTGPARPGPLATWYEHFPRVSDRQVGELLAAASRWAGTTSD